MLLIQRNPANEEHECEDNSVWVGDSLITLIKKDGRSYLAIRAPLEVPILRAELVDNHDERAEQIRNRQPVDPIISDGAVFKPRPVRASREAVK